MMDESDENERTTNVFVINQLSERNYAQNPVHIIVNIKSSLLRLGMTL